MKFGAKKDRVQSVLEGWRKRGVPGTAKDKISRDMMLGEMMKQVGKGKLHNTRRPFK
jgi:hypothetical protein